MISTEKRFRVEKIKPKNVFDWNNQTEKRFPVENSRKAFPGWNIIFKPKNVFWLKILDRKAFPGWRIQTETFPGWRIQTEKRFPVEYNIQTEKRFPVENIKPENVFRLKKSNKNYLLIKSHENLSSTPSTSRSGPA